MKISVTVSIDLDPANWAGEYNTDNSPTSVRADVKEYLAEYLRMLPAFERTEAVVTVR